VSRLLLAAALALAATPLAAREFHVSPAGADAAAGTAAAPFRTAAAAVAAARRSPGPDTILFAEGRHELAAPLDLGPDDAGLTLAAAPGARPVLSGGVRLTGWRRSPTNAALWQVELPAVRAGTWTFHQLFVDGRRATPARTPNEGFFRAAGPLGPGTPITLPFKPGDLKPAWANHPGAKLVMLQKWTDLHVPILSVDPAANVATIGGDRPRPDWMSEPDARYWVEGVPDALDAPGEWLLDRAAGVLRYLAPAGVDPNTAVVVAPRLTELVRVRGDAAARRAVTGVAFRGLTFAESDYVLAAGGVISPQAAVPVRGAVRVEHAADGAFEGCRFVNLGGYALDFGRGAQGWRVSRCEVREAGGGGVRLGEPDDTAPDAFTANHSHEITDSRLVGLGRIFAPACGIIIFQSGTNRVAHNEIADLFYTAVSVGWHWGYGATPCRANVIESNRLHRIGQGRLSDMGGVYTLGPQPGTVVRGNLIHDVESHDYGGWGLYTDEGSTGIMMEGNVVYRCRSAGFHQHYGRENVIRNNVLAWNRENQVMRTRDEDHVSFLFTNNVVIFDAGRLLGSSWRNDRFVMAGNVYWDTRAGADAAKYDFAGASWDAWRARGHDTNSVIADPLFLDARGLDFRLRPESPARRLGFRPVDVSAAGPRP
jgi:hypothetical protein